MKTIGTVIISIALTIFATNANAALDATGQTALFSAVAGILFVITLGGLVKYSRDPEMLCDSPPQPIPDNYVRPYSLGKVQMAWWFIIIIASYLYIWAITSHTPSLSPSLLALAGISGATGIVSTSISETQIANKAYPKHVSFFRDLVTDANGITLHRFQMFAMTIVLGVIYFIQVATSEKLPTEFDGTTLGLMGISAGTYLGFKIPEKQ